MSKLVGMNTDVLSSDAAKDVLRTLFDDEVLNHGSYNVVFAHDHQHDSELAGYLIGYRFAPLELVALPFTLSLDPEHMELATPVTRWTTIGADLTNLVDIADLGSSYRLELSTERSFLFEVSEHTLISWPCAGPEERILVELEQASDAADFHAFMHQVFDRFEEFDQSHQS